MDPPSETDWPALAARVLAGDQEAAATMVEQLYTHVMRIVRSHLPRATDEQDISQDIFMKVFSRLETWRGDQPLTHWVARIAVNACYDRLRRQKSRPEVRFADLSEDEAAFLENTFSGGDQADAPRDSDGSEVVEKLLATLNATEQTVLRLLDMEQKSVQEITELTGWGASKIKVTAMRARRKLNETLKRLESSGKR